MVTRPAKPVLTVRVANTVAMAVLAAFAHLLKQTLKILLLLVRQATRKPVFTLANVKRSPKRKPGVKEVEAAMAIVGNMGVK